MSIVISLTVYWIFFVHLPEHIFSLALTVNFFQHLTIAKTLCIFLFVYSNTENSSWYITGAVNNIYLLNGH